MTKKQVRGTEIIYLNKGESLPDEEKLGVILFDESSGGHVYIKPAYLCSSIQFSYDEGPFLEEAKKLWQDVALDRIHPTGTVVVADGTIIAGAGNGKFYEEEKDCERKQLGVASGTRYDLCNGNHSFENHSEARAVNDAKLKLGDSAKNLTAYLYGHWWCCEPCCKAMIAAGVTKVVMSKSWTKEFLGI